METRGQKGTVALSKRLGMLAGMVAAGSRLADIGCDHGFLSIYLVQAGICPRAIAMDVRKGPLAGAERHVEEYGLSDYITLRLSDGLLAYRAGEADTLVCSGMGGRLMERILREGLDKVRQMRELILQPQSELRQFRAFLRETGFQTVKEDAVCEDGKYYFAIKLRPGEAGQEPGHGDRAAIAPEYDMFGELMLKDRHPVLLAYLRQRRDYLEGLSASLQGAGSARAGGRLGEVQEELALTKKALSYYG